MLNRLRRLIASLRKYGDPQDLALLDDLTTAIAALEQDDSHALLREAERITGGRRSDFATRADASRAA